MKRTMPNFADGAVCPICGTDESEDVVLVPMDRGEKGKLACQAIVVHVDCVLNYLRYSPPFNDATGSVPGLVYALADKCDEKYKNVRKKG